MRKMQESGSPESQFGPLNEESSQGSVDLKNSCLLVTGAEQKLSWPQLSAQHLQLC